jgi:deazaflavin-dependent oxidoreductase (nitroreductase family)
MSNKPTPNDSLKDRLSRSREINITVTGRKSGRAISIPVWFVSEDNKLYLLPVSGSDTQWYKNVQKNPFIQIVAATQRPNGRSLQSPTPNRWRP